MVNILILDDATDDVRETKVVSSVDSDVSGVLVFRQQIVTESIVQKVDPCHLISFKKHILVLRDHIRLKERTDPGDKGKRLIMEKMDFLVCLLMKVE